MIRNRNILAKIRFAPKEKRTIAWYKKRKKRYLSRNRDRVQLSSGIPISVSVPRKAKERARLHVQNDAASASFSFSLLSSLLLHHFSLSLSLSFLGIGPRAQSFTENTECRRSRESYAAKFSEEGPEGREEGRQECVCVRVVAPGSSMLTFLPLFIALCRGWMRRFRYFSIVRRHNCPNIIE